ncbi:MAG: Gfo/Idh/MocA family protein [Limnochordia bacterium]
MMPGRWFAFAKSRQFFCRRPFRSVFSTPVVRAKEVIESGAIGKVVAINGTNHGRMPPGWFLDPELAGGGAVFDSHRACHRYYALVLEQRSEGSLCGSG